MALNPAKKFPEFDGYAVFMNEQLEGTMDEDSLDPRLGNPLVGGKQNNKQLTMKHKVVEYDFLGNLFKMKSGSMRWTGVNEVNMDVQSWISWIDCIMLHQKQSYFGRLRAKWDAFTERQKRAYQEFFRGIGQV